MIKRLLNAEFSRKIVTWLAAQYIRFVSLSGRWRIVGEAVPDGLLAKGEPFIVAFWHGRLIMMAFSWRRCDLVHMLSQHSIAAVDTRGWWRTPLLSRRAR